MLLCLQVEISSVLEFKEVCSSAVMMWYFSQVQRLQRFVRGEYGRACCMIRQLMVYGVSLSFRVQMCLLSSVLVLFSVLLKLDLWDEYLVLNEFDVRPM